jgi:hypothetical protein
VTLATAGKEYAQVWGVAVSTQDLMAWVPTYWQVDALKLLAMQLLLLRRRRLLLHCNDPAAQCWCGRSRQNH